MIVDKNHAEIVERCRAALELSADAVRGELRVRTEGTVDGLPAEGDVVHHADGRLLSRTRSRLPGACGFDGLRGWSVDATGLPGPLELEDLETFRLTSAVWSGRWTLPESGIEVKVRATSSTAIVLELRAGRMPFFLHLDPRTARPTKLVEPLDPEVVTTFHELGRGPWGLVPVRTTTQVGWLQDETRVIRVERAEEPSDFRAPTNVPEDTSFDPRAQPELALGRTRRGHLPVVEVSAGTRALGAFLVDTGAGSLGIDAATADALGLEALGRTWVTTADGGAGAPYRIGGSLTIGPMTIERPIFLELDVEPLSRALGTKITGVLGHDFFARAAVRVSATDRRLVVLPPERAVELERGPWRPLRFEGDRPLVQVTSVFGSDLLALDTASSVEALLYVAGAKAWSVPKATGSKASARGLTGVETTTSRRIPWLDVAGTRFEDVSMAMSAAATGAGASPAKLGVVGWGLVKDADVDLDYRRARIQLTPRTSGRPPRARRG